MPTRLVPILRGLSANLHLHVLFNPIGVRWNAGVNTRKVRFTTPPSPSHDTKEFVVNDKWTATIK